MKKLMFAAAAIAAGVAFADDAIVSQNIVGYLQYDNIVDEEPANAKSVGYTFSPVGGGETFKLSEIKLTGDGYMTPGNEYIQYLSPATTRVQAMYVYINYNLLVEAYGEDADDYLWTIGWWEYQEEWDFDTYAVWFEETDDTHKVKDTVTFPMGTAFLGSFNGVEFSFVSGGEALQVTSEITNVDDNENVNSALYFVNYIPRTIDINEIEVSDPEGTGYMTPGNEYLQVLSPATTRVTAMYVYINYNLLVEAYGEDADNYLWTIGWWEYQEDWDFDTYAEWFDEPDDTHKIKSFDVNSGDAFLGSLNGVPFTFKFPAATASATK